MTKRNEIPSKITDAEQDWRLYCIAHVEDANPANAHKGDIVKVIFPRFLYKEREISIGLPNVCALYLDFSFKLFNQATDIRNKAVLKTKNGRIPDKLAFDYFEKIATSIILAFCAIETFANNEIPDAHIHYKKWKKLYLAENKITIQRHESTDIKIGTILPESKNIESPKGKEVWENYIMLKNFRDRIVHQKSTDQIALINNPPSIWQNLFSPDLPCFPKIALDLISYFHKANPENIPRWLILINQIHCRK